MAVKLTTIERDYFVRKASGAPPVEPLNNIKRRYMSGVVGVGVNAQTPLHQLEKLWLLAVIGGPALDFNSIEELWRQAVMAIGQTPGTKLEENKIKFFQNAP